MGFMLDRKEVVLRYIVEQKAEEQSTGDCFLFENNEIWSYGQALVEGYRAANALSESGVRRGENVLVFLPNSRDWIRAWWGISFLGAVLTPVNPVLKGSLLRHHCQDSQAGVIITSPKMAERLDGLELDLKIIHPSVLAEGRPDEPKPDTPLEPWDIYAIMYTSGTTGPSKGVISPYLQTYMNGLVCYGNDITKDDTFLIDIPLHHVAAQLIINAVLRAGARIALREVFSAGRYWDIIREYGVTMSCTPGTMAPFLMKSPSSPKDADNPLRCVTMAPIVNDPRSFMDRFGIEKIVNTFGMTEISQPILNPDPINHPKSCGKVRPGVEVRLVDEHDIPVPIGEKGELIVRTDLPWEMNVGYLNQPEETARAWRNGWFHTGDLFYCDDEGYYYYVDRNKDTIRRRGENISSFEVEEEVRKFPDVLETACVAASSDLGEDEVKVFVVPHEGVGFDPAELIRFLIPRMPHYMVPRYVEIIDEMPKTPTTRVKKHMLRERGNSPSTWDRETAGIKVSRAT